MLPRTVCSKLAQNIPARRHVWLLVARGKVRVNRTVLGRDDGATLSDEHELVIKGEKKAEILLFDLA